MKYENIYHYLHRHSILVKMQIIASCMLQKYSKHIMTLIITIKTKSLHAFFNNVGKIHQLTYVL